MKKAILHLWAVLILIEIHNSKYLLFDIQQSFKFYHYIKLSSTDIIYMAAEIFTEYGISAN